MKVFRFVSLLLALTLSPIFWESQTYGAPSSTDPFESFAIESLRQDLHQRLDRGEFVSTRILLERLGLTHTLLKGFPIPFAPQALGYHEFHLHLASALNEESARRYLFEPLHKTQHRLRSARAPRTILRWRSFSQIGVTESYLLAAHALLKAHPSLRVPFLETLEALLFDFSGREHGKAGERLYEWLLTLYSREVPENTDRLESAHVLEWVEQSAPPESYEPALHRLRQKLYNGPSVVADAFPIPFSPQLEQSATERLLWTWKEGPESNPDLGLETFLEFARSDQLSFAQFIPVRIAFWELQNETRPEWTLEQQSALASALEQRITDVEEQLQQAQQPTLQALLLEEHLALIDLRSDFPIPFSPEFTLKAASPLEQLSWSRLSEALNSRLPPPVASKGFPIPFSTEDSVAALEAPYQALSLGAFAPFAQEGYCFRLGLEGKRTDLTSVASGPLEGWRASWVQAELSPVLKSRAFLDAPDSPQFLERLIEQTPKDSELLYLYADIIRTAQTREHWGEWLETLRQQEWRIRPVEHRYTKSQSSADSSIEDTGLWERIKGFFSKSKPSAELTVDLEPQFRTILNHLTPPSQSEPLDCNSAFESNTTPLNRGRWG